MVSMTVTAKGPLFAGDTVRMLGEAIREVIRETTYFGEEAVQDQLYSGHGVRTGWFRFHIRGRLMQSRHGAIFAKDYVKGAWLESGANHRYGTTRFKGYAMFRRGRDRTDREVQRIGDRIIAGFVRRVS